MDIVWVSALLAPAALDSVTRDLSVVSGHYGVSCRLLGGESEIMCEDTLNKWREILRRKESH